jgi:hypothetical protein
MGPLAPAPTAWQKLAETHEALFSDSSVRPLWALRSGVFLICHDVPFQISARLTSLPELLKCPPTAAQKLAETQDTPLSVLLVARPGLPRAAAPS